MKNEVAEIFNEMKNDYDDLQDLWYSWLFSRLHHLIVKNSILPHQPKKVLDVGCGSGFQSFLFALGGSDVTGIDIAKDLIDLANSKKNDFLKDSSYELFPSHYSFVSEYSIKIRESLSKLSNTNRIIAPEFKFGDALNIDFEDETFDHVNCCGSTLNFIRDYTKSLAEISRVLKPNGTFSIEVDARWNMDLFWPILDSIFFGKLDYDMTIKEALSNLFSPVNNHIRIDYPFGDAANPVMMDLWLFTKRGLKKDLHKQNLLVTSTFSIHGITNFIPSTLLDSANPNKILKTSFQILSKLEEVPVLKQFPGCSLVLFGHKGAID